MQNCTLSCIFSPFTFYFLLFYSIFATRIGIYGAENPGLYTE